MQQPIIYLIVGAVIAGASIAGYKFYQDSRQKAGIEIGIGEGGVTVDRK